MAVARAERYQLLEVVGQLEAPGLDFDEEVVEAASAVNSERSSPRSMGPCSISSNIQSKPECDSTSTQGADASMLQMPMVQRPPFRDCLKPLTGKSILPALSPG